MLSRRITVGALAVGAVGAALIAASPAYALTTASVTAGSAPSGANLNLTGSATNPTLKDLRSGVTLSCNSSGASGTAKVGSGQSPNGIAKINSSTWTACSVAGVTFTVAQNTVWSVNATVATSGGVTGGTITNISATLTGGGCKFDVTGSAAGSYNNSNTTLSIASSSSSPTLTISNTRNATTGAPITNCIGGIVANGDTSQFTGAYSISATNAATGAAANPVAINAS